MNKYTNHIRNDYHIAKRKVMHLLEWDALQYALFQEKCGRMYLQYYIPHSPEYIDAMLMDGIYWNWFKNQWMLRDNAFLRDEIVIDADTITRQHLYKLYNSPDRLIGERFPTGIVMESGFAKMIGQFNKKLSA